MFIFLLFYELCLLFRLEIYNKTITEFSFRFFQLEMYNRTIIGFGFCDMQNYQYLGKSYPPADNTCISQKSHPIIVYNRTCEIIAYLKSLVFSAI